jgi:hypothetical protein
MKGFQVQVGGFYVNERKNLVREATHMDGDGNAQWIRIHEIEVMHPPTTSTSRGAPAGRDREEEFEAVGELFYPTGHSMQRSVSIKEPGDDVNAVGRVSMRTHTAS